MVNQDHKDRKDHQARQDKEDPPVSKDSRDLLEHPDRKVHRVPLDSQDLREALVLVDQPDLLVQLATLAVRDLMETRDSPDRLAPKVRRELPEIRVSRVIRGHLVRLVHWVCQVLTVIQVPQVLEVALELQVMYISCNSPKCFSRFKPVFCFFFILCIRLSLDLSGFSISGICYKF